MTGKRQEDDLALERLLREAGGRGARPGMAARMRARTALRRETATVSGARAGGAEAFPDILCAVASLPILAAACLVLLGVEAKPGGTAADLLLIVPAMNVLCLPMAAGIIVRSRRKHAL